jgi:hypothetical protein
MQGTLVPWRSILMPDRGRICLASHRGVKYKDLSLHERNHNLFRLDVNGNVLWQVRRDEGGAFDVAAIQARAKELGIAGGHLSGWEPFMTLGLVHADGPCNLSETSSAGPEANVSVPGCTVRSSSLGGHGYVIDIDTRIATNVTGRAHGAW